MKKWIPLVLICFAGLPSCKSTATFEVKVKPDLVIPRSAKKIAIVDRCRFYVNLVRNLEDPRQRKTKEELQYNYGVLTAMQSLSERWQELEVADSIFVPYNIELYNADSVDKVPEKMNWEEAIRISKKLNADILVVLERYESSYVNSNRGSLDFTIQSVWRIYDIRSKTVISELHMQNSPMVLYSAYDGTEKHAREVAGRMIGEQIAARVQSQSRTVYRLYYKRAFLSPPLKYGSSYARRDEWKSAVTKWLPVTESRTRSLSRKACLNMAVAAEKLGRPQLAIDWAQRASEKGSRLARQYLVELEQEEESKVIGN
ncbi:MAG: hypothetical protein FD123_3305 [Bacteroidetes bacterium]|nr:MAG: hypothetical protein FD123_3305 [Bacteroidota bacterium]